MASATDRSPAPCRSACYSAFGRPPGAARSHPVGPQAFSPAAELKDLVLKLLEKVKEAADRQGGHLDELWHDRRADDEALAVGQGVTACRSRGVEWLRPLRWRVAVRVRLRIDYWHRDLPPRGTKAVCYLAEYDAGARRLIGTVVGRPDGAVREEQ